MLNNFVQILGIPLISDLIKALSAGRKNSYLQSLVIGFELVSSEK